MTLDRPIVTLTRAEAYQAGSIGFMRRMSGIFDHKQHKGNLSRDNDYGFSMDIESTMAELALAKWLSCFWTGVNSGACDCGIYQVRWSWREDAHLIIRKDDSALETTVLVVGVCPTFKLCGWMENKEAKTEKYWPGMNPNRPGFWVPQQDLKEMYLLKKGDKTNEPTNKKMEIISH